MAWGEFKKVMELNNSRTTCPNCKVKLRAQDEVDAQVWENVDNVIVGFCTIGTVDTAGSSFRQTRYICRKCRRQFVILPDGKPKETLFSKYLLIR